VRTIITSRLLRGAFAVMLAGASLLVVTALSPFAEEQGAPVALDLVGTGRNGMSLSAGFPYGFPCGAVLPPEVDYREDEIEVTLRDVYEGATGGPDMHGCILEIELEERIDGRAVLDGSCLEREPIDRDDCRRWPR